MIEIGFLMQWWEALLLAVLLGWAWRLGTVLGESVYGSIKAIAQRKVQS